MPPRSGVVDTVEIGDKAVAGGTLSGKVTRLSIDLAVAAKIEVATG
jgi:hypothetical protein